MGDAYEWTAPRSRSGRERRAAYPSCMPMYMEASPAPAYRTKGLLPAPSLRPFVPASPPALGPTSHTSYLLMCHRRRARPHTHAAVCAR